MDTEILYTRTLDGVDWQALTDSLRADDFDNGRTPEQLRLSFANSQHVCFAWSGDRLIGKGRVLSDGIGNAYLIDLWTHSAYRSRGIASKILDLLLADLPGQHIYLQADDDLVSFYEGRGFRRQPNGMSRIVGQYLRSAPAPQPDE